MTTLNEDQVTLVRTSWATLKPQAARFTDVLYEELFSAEPQLRFLFAGPMDEQHIKLAAAITLVMDHLGDPSMLQRELRNLGQRHEGYGVRPYHFEAIEGAFDRTLERLLGVSYTPEMKDAWSMLIHHVTATMQGAE